MCRSRLNRQENLIHEYVLSGSYTQKVNYFPSVMRKRNSANASNVTVSARINPRLRFALLLQARDGYEAISEIFENVIAAVVLDDTTATQKYTLSTYANLWDPEPWVRLRNVNNFASKLLSKVERDALKELDAATPDTVTPEVWAKCIEGRRIEL